MTDAAVAAMAAARLTGTAVAWPDGLALADEDAGYRLQAALAERLAAEGWGAPVGWKVGATTAVMQELLAIDHPCAGAVLATRCFPERARLAFGDLCRPGIECEIAVRLGADIEARKTPHDARSVAPFVATAMAAMELVDDRYGDFRAWSPAALIADDFFQSAAVLGPEVADWQDLDLAALEGITRIDGVEAGRGRGAEVMGHPLAALAWLANRFAALGRTLRKGEVVLLGSLVAVRWLPGPARAETEIVGLGRVELSLS